MLGSGFRGSGFEGFGAFEFRGLGFWGLGFRATAANISTATAVVGSSAGVATICIVELIANSIFLLVLLPGLGLLLNSCAIQTWRSWCFHRYCRHFVTTAVAATMMVRTVVAVASIGLRRVGDNSDDERETLNPKHR